MLITDTDPKIKESFMKALRVYGKERQIQVAVGECGEFLTEVGRMAQGRATDASVIDEIADCLIMMNKMAIIYGEDAVKARIKVKLRKIKRRLDKFK